VSVAIVAGSLAAVAAAQAPPTFHAEARLVVLAVTVTNARGELVPDLGRDAFRVFEDGRPQPISLFRSHDAPVSLGLVVDNSASMRPVRERVEAAALAFVRASNPGDEVFVVNFADYARLDVPMTGDLRVLEAGIGRRDSIGGSAVRDAIRVADGYLRARAAHARRALLVISDGKDTASVASERELRRLAERGGVAIHALELGGAGGAAPRRGDGELERIAGLTGGLVRRAASVAGIEPVILEIAHGIRSEYTVAYTPANQVLDGSFRTVRVEVTRPPGLRARTRPGYRATAAP
jgi:Ca-activated chloride channel homolog